MENSILIPRPEKLEKIKSAMAVDGPEKFHILADFDQTLTQAFVDEKLVPPIISILRDGNYLTPDYAKKAHALFDKYHPVEIDPNVPLPEKKKAMNEWWMAHFELLIKSGLNKKDIEAVTNSGKIKLRPNFYDFIKFLHDRDIPLVIMSSSGLGGDAIALLIEKEKCFYDKVYIISNTFLWDERGNAIGVREPIIHALNKYETMLQDFPAYGVIKNRKNVTLLGNGVDDIGMVEGFDYENLIKVGFLNEEVEKNLEYFKENFDIILLGDPSMDYVNKLLQEIFI